MTTVVGLPGFVIAQRRDPTIPCLRDGATSDNRNAESDVRRPSAHGGTPPAPPEPQPERIAT